MDENTKKIKELLEIEDTWQARRLAAINNSIPGEHAWFKFRESDPGPCCAICGYVKNNINSKRSCIGKIKIALR